MCYYLINYSNFIRLIYHFNNIFNINQKHYSKSNPPQIKEKSK